MGEKTNESAIELSNEGTYAAYIVEDNKERIVDGKGTFKDLEVEGDYISIKYDIEKEQKREQETDSPSI